MSETIKRINPRRPFHVTPAGLKRIVLGESGGAEGQFHGAAHAAEKPVRQLDTVTGHLLAVVHSDRGALEEPARQAVATAALLADASTAVTVLVLGSLSDDLTALGADRIVVVPACDRVLFDPERDLAVVSDMVAQLAPRHILLAENVEGSGDLGRRLSVRLKNDSATHVAEISGQHVAVYWQEGALFARRDLPRVIVLDGGTTDTELPFRGAGEVVDYQMPGRDGANAYEDLGMMALDAADVSLEEADFIVSAGNGVADVETIQALATAYNAAVGASRVAVDDGKFPRDRQVGATGKTVNADVYIAFGISGAVQHLQGIKSCRHVISVNTDASAPMSGRADLTIVEDTQAIMREMLAAAQNRNWSGDEAGS